MAVAYRLGIVIGDHEQCGDLTWVTVPGLGLAISGVRPNPVIDRLHVSFTLAGSAPASPDEILDLGGRRVVSRQVGSLGAGSHTVISEEVSRLPSGIYMVRLTQGKRSAFTKVAVLL